MKKVFITAFIAMTLIGTQAQASSIVEIDKEKIVNSIVSLGCLATTTLAMVMYPFMDYDTCLVLKLVKKEKDGK